MEAMVEVDMDAALVTDGALNLVLDLRTETLAPLSGNDFALAEPSGEQIEEVNPVLDKDSAALFPVPEPMLRREVLVRGIVFEVAVQHPAQHFAGDDGVTRSKRGL